MDQTLQNDRVPSRKVALGATIGEHLISIHDFNAISRRVAECGSQMLAVLFWKVAALNGLAFR